MRVVQGTLPVEELSADDKVHAQGLLPLDEDRVLSADPPSRTSFKNLCKGNTIGFIQHGPPLG